MSDRMNDSVPIDPQAICFGFDRATDEGSLKLFLRLFADDRLLAALLPRLTDQELGGLVDSLTGLMRRHLSEEEYHQLFLRDRH